MSDHRFSLGHRLQGWLLATGLAAAVTCLPASAQATEPSKFLALGTGASNGVFYEVGQGICQLLNAGRLEHGFRCLAYSTGAAVYNIQALGTGELDLGITYANLAQEAATGEGVFAKDGPTSDLRAIATLYQMPTGVIVNRSLAAESLDDLAGLRINIGNVGSGKRTIADAILKAMQWTAKDFAKVTELSTDEVERPFCNGEIDVIVESMATDSDFFDRIASKCAGKFVTIPAAAMARVLAVAPALEQIGIPGGTFPHNPKDFQTLGIRAILLTSERVNADAIYAVTDSIFGKNRAFRLLHPALADTTPEVMLRQGIYLPFHPGAERYFRDHALPYGKTP